MAAPGSRTRTTDLWLLPEDEARLGGLIGAALPGSGWLCSHPGPRGLHQVHLHPSPEAALACGGTQAFLLLPEGAQPPEDVLVDSATARPRPGLPHAAVLQLLRSRHVRRPDGEVFEAGRLAVRWYESEVGPETHRLLTEQTRVVWRALRAATRPAAVELADGRRISGLRIGPAAHALVTATGMPLTRGGSLRLRLAG